MRVLISAVGDTDPFRNFHDGALIHIARKYRPEKVILIFSEHTAKKQGNIEKALFSIAPDYEPELIIHDSIISDNEVHIFDVMFQRFSDILQEYYTTEDEFILNLSSATPQIKSALFVINRLNGINVKAVQVSSPEHASNENIGHDNDENIDELIEVNEDNKVNFIDRTIEDNAEKFSQALLKKTARDFIEKFDYKAALDILDQLSDFPNLKSVRKEIRDVVNCLSKQDVPQGLRHKKFNEEEQKILSAYLTIELQRERGNVSESFIRIKNLTEFILEDYIEKRNPGLIDDYCESIQKYYLSLFDYSKLLKATREFKLRKTIAPIIEMNSSRNTVAHSLSPLDSDAVNQLGIAMKTLKTLVREQYHFSQSDFNFYQDLNKKLLTKLN
ncbi:type III-A CRISPR-associated protein Csm6 [Streptococcus sp. HMSC064H09]|jgi:CRISPR-associated protein, csm6 family|uniref:type III-A CRISPR-associated CARF protein Csm6 n=1 Tax=Streptococcus sp. HMSC064H09 TaxID=1739371 RepID=UPI0008A26C8D|nr:type III-A CRISPR-associated CARF protein Csm6 [Streptococcus sp. HMSC064H09]OFR76847.1 type III-A CRISPR-associated protein Csm6 [Streptococcus sp. HMSC064H09]